MSPKLNVTKAECHEAECHKAECHEAECQSVTKRYLSTYIPTHLSLTYLPIYLHWRTPTYIGIDLSTSQPLYISFLGLLYSVPLDVNQPDPDI